MKSLDLFGKVIEPLPEQMSIIPVSVIDVWSHDEVIFSRKSVSKIKVMLPQAKRLGYTVKVHETLLVFAKA